MCSNQTKPGGTFYLSFYVIRWTSVDFMNKSIDWKVPLLLGVWPWQSVRLLDNRFAERLRDLVSLKWLDINEVQQGHTFHSFFREMNVEVIGSHQSCWTLLHITVRTWSSHLLKQVDHQFLLLQLVYQLWTGEFDFQNKQLFSCLYMLMVPAL